MNTAMAIFAALPPIAWVLWRAAKPYMLCRDVEAGAITKDSLFHLLVEAALYVAIPLFLLLKQQWNATVTALFVAMFLIGLSGIIRTAIAYQRIKKASNNRFQGTRHKVSGPLNRDVGRKRR